MNCGQGGEPYLSGLSEVLPPGVSGPGPRSSSPQQPVQLHCQPTDDSDVSDGIRQWRNIPACDRLYFGTAQNPGGCDFDLPVEEAQGPPVGCYGAQNVFSLCTSDINLHSEETGRGEDVRDGKEDDLAGIGRDQKCTLDGRAEEEWPVFGNTPTECDVGEVSILKRNYSKLLEKHQQFVISNARLHDANEELGERVSALEKELCETREEARRQESEKMRVIDELQSLKRTLFVLKEPMAMIATEAGQGAPTDGEWTSSVKEELRQAVMLAITQQQDLHNLYQVIKRQSDIIRELNTATRSNTRGPATRGHSEDAAGTLTIHDSRPKDLELRRIPEGSSLCEAYRSPVGKSKPSQVPATETKPPLPLTKSIRELFRPQKRGNSPEKPAVGKTTATTAVKSTSPTATVAKQQLSKQSCLSRGYHGDRDVQLTRPPGMNPVEGAYVHSADIDPENNSFVFVSTSQAEVRICPLCGKTFSSADLTMEQFTEHVSRCSPPDEFRQCPICLQKFEKTFSDMQLEVHVNEHFDDDRFLCLSPTAGRN